MGGDVLIDRLNEALGWELRAMSMYAHYAANVPGHSPIATRPDVQRGGHGIVGPR